MGDSYTAWIQKQPSCISGMFSEYVFGEGRNVACHVRRASNSGVGYKGNNLVPMTHTEHLLQHTHGELAVLQKYRPDTNMRTSEAAKAWFDLKANFYTQLYRRKNNVG